MVKCNKQIFTKIEYPTVSDMINALKKFPPDQPLRIRDPDTNWTISVIRILDRGEVLWLTADYAEMDKDNEW